MRIRNLSTAAVLGLTALGLSACATGINTQVSRYQAATIPAGQTFYVVQAQGPQTAEFNRFAAMVAQQLEAKGFKPAGAPQIADMLVKLDYGVDEGKTEIVDDRPLYGPSPYRWGRYGWSYGDPFFDPYWGVYGGRPYWSRWGGYPYYYGWDDPFWYSSPYAGTSSPPLATSGPLGRYAPYGGRYSSSDNRAARPLPPGVREYTIFKSYLDMDIVRRTDNAKLFEGHAKARSQSDEVDKLVPPLIEAMFTGFPGKNGQTVKITVPTRKN